MRIRSKSLIVTLCLIGGLPGCYYANVTVTPVGVGRTYAATPDSIAMTLYAVAKPDCPFDEIAAITAFGSDGDTALARLKSEARALGADAIAGYNQDREAVRSGTAIRFRSRDCRT